MTTYIGCGAVIIGNVNRGSGSAIGAMSVVTKDIKLVTTVIGNSAREI